MKVLSVTWDIYNNKIEKFKGICTGGGLVINNICEYIGRKVESYLFVGRYKMPEIHMDHYVIVNTEKNDNDTCVEKEGNPQEHLAYMTEKFKETLQNVNPDIVNVHGIGDLAIRCIDICEEVRIPYVYTEHLFIGPGKPVEGYETTVKLEEVLYNKKGLKIISVSNGMKRRILEDFPLISARNIQVILNGTDFKSENFESDLSKLYGLKGMKVLVCSGTLLIRKNQLQIVRAFKLLPMKVRKGIKILFCGRDKLNGAFQKAILENKLEENLVYVGALSSDDMKNVYSVSDGLIMPSIAEGLSIAALEAMSYGMPLIMFADSECAADLSDKNVTCFAYNRTDEDLADAIVRWYEKDWDKDYIISQSKYYSMERVADDYVRYYEDIIDDCKTNTDKANKSVYMRE